MNDLARALETSVLLAEKTASSRAPSDDLRQRRALADFATFGLFKRAGIDPTSLAKGLGWGVGLGLPALGAGHMLMRDARHQGEGLIRDARNQALLTAAGVGGMQALGELLKRRTPPVRHDVNVSMPQQMQPQMQPPLDLEQKVAAAILVDDVLEGACALADPDAKHAALVVLIQHRSEAVELLRSLFT